MRASSSFSSLVQTIQAARGTGRASSLMRFIGLSFVDDCHACAELLPVEFAFLPPVMYVHEVDIEQVGDALALGIEQSLFV